MYRKKTYYIYFTLIGGVLKETRRVQIENEVVSDNEGIFTQVDWVSHLIASLTKFELIG
jgi:hypothetical protein